MRRLTVYFIKYSLNVCKALLALLDLAHKVLDLFDAGDLALLVIDAQGVGHAAVLEALHGFVVALLRLLMLLKDSLQVQLQGLCGLQTRFQLQVDVGEVDGGEEHRFSYFTQSLEGVLSE